MSRRPAPRSKKPALPPRKETLPQHQYPKPYSRILNLGAQPDFDAYEEILEEVEGGDIDKVVAQLVQIATDLTFYSYIDLETFPDSEDPFQYDLRLNAPVHAVILLTGIYEAAHTAIEGLLPAFASPDEEMESALAGFYAATGEPAIPFLSAVVLNPEIEPDLRVVAGECLQEIGGVHPDLYERCVQALCAALTLEQEPEAAVCFVFNLLELRATDALPLIETAYKEGRVDAELMDFESVKEVMLTADEPEEEGEEEEGEWDDEDEEEEEEAEAAGEEGVQQPFVTAVKAGRNDLCPCGSGKKYKKCCGATV